jgi:hypothetical protein
MGLPLAREFLRLEIEGHAGCDGFGLVACNHVIVRVSATYTVTMPADSQTVMRACAMFELG